METTTFTSKVRRLTTVVAIAMLFTLVAYHDTEDSSMHLGVCLDALCNIDQRSVIALGCGW